LRILRLPEILYIFVAVINNYYLPDKFLSTMTDLKQLSPREAYAAYMMGGVMVDVRESAETQQQTPDIKRLVKLPFSELDKRFAELPQNQPVMIVSRVGVKSKEAARFLLANGYSQVFTIDGGINAWEEEGLPLRNTAH